jgi:hypothetical protein
MKHLIAGCLSLLLLTGAGCTVSDKPTAPTSTTTGPAQIGAPTAAGIRYRVDSDASWLRVRVYKTGPLARFGHDHVIASSALSGSVVLADPFADSAFVLELPLADLVVDDPAARRAEGELFAKDIPDKDRAGTRRNMLGEKLLNAQIYPNLTLTSIAIDGAMTEATAQVRVSIAGEQHRVEFPFTVRVDDDRLHAEGSATLTHAQLGLEPFSALGGALRVREDIDLRYDIVAVLDEEML